MLSGICYLVLTGVLWVILGAVIGRAGKENQNLSFIQGGSALVIMALTLPWIFFSGSALPVILLFLLPAAGISNYFTFILMAKAMKNGPNGLVWAMIQCAFVMPFLMGIIVFSVPAAWTRVTGIILLLTAMILMGLYGKRSNESAGKGEWGWLLCTAGAFLFSAAGQCCANLPSYLIPDGAMDHAMRIFRTGLSSCGIAGIWLFRGCFDRKIFDCRNCFTGLILMASTTLVATWCIYTGLDKMANAGAGAIGYPVTMGATITAFQIYSRIFLKEKITLPIAGCIALCVTAIVLISL